MRLGKASRARVVPVKVLHWLETDFECFVTILLKTPSPLPLPINSHFSVLKSSPLKHHPETFFSVLLLPPITCFLPVCVQGWRKSTIFFFFYFLLTYNLERLTRLRNTELNTAVLLPWLDTTSVAEVTLASLGTAVPNLWALQAANRVSGGAKENDLTPKRSALTSCIS